MSDGQPPLLESGPSGPPSPSGPSGQVGARVGAGADGTTRRWAVGVLSLATLALAAWLALVAVAAWALGSAIEVVMDRDVGALNLTPLIVESAPGLLVGWAVGRAAAAVLGRGEALGPRGAGVAAGSLGVLAGAAVLAATGVL